VVYSTVKILPALSSARPGTYTAPKALASPRGEVLHDRPSLVSWLEAVSPSLLLGGYGYNR